MTHKTTIRHLLNSLNYYKDFFKLKFISAQVKQSYALYYQYSCKSVSLHAKKQPYVVLAWQPLSFERFTVNCAISYALV